ncbi:MAG: hypothetical protein IJJ96_07895 [Bacteroidales bacterium]|nr:hypothetical protein [Bacteroidales bacterium]
MERPIPREAALELLKKYNKAPFHLRHALTEKVLFATDERMDSIMAFGLPCRTTQS